MRRSLRLRNCHDQGIALAGSNKIETICVLGKAVTLRYGWNMNERLRWGNPNSVAYGRVLSFIETAGKLKCLMSHNIFFYSVEGLEEILEAFDTIKCMAVLKPPGLDLTFDIFEGRPRDEAELDEGGVNLFGRQIHVSRWLADFAVNSDDIEARAAAISFSKDHLEAEAIENL